jgi:hypothetical protein
MAVVIVGGGLEGHRRDLAVLIGELGYVRGGLG